MTDPTNQPSVPHAGEVLKASQKRRALEMAVSAAPLLAAALSSVLVLSRKTRPLGAVLTATLTASALPALRFPQNPKPSGDSPSFSLLSSNVLYKNDSPSKAAKFYIESNADVLVLLERADHIARLIPHHAYPFRTVVAALDERSHCYDLTVLSKIPFSHQGSVLASGRAFPVLEFLVKDTPVSLVPVHLSAQHHAIDKPFWRRQLLSLGTNLSSLKAENVVVCGDFNASLTHRSMRHSLRLSGLVSLSHRHRSVFRGTWGPNGRFAILPIDHVLVSSNIHSTTLEYLKVPGSDHRALFTRLKPSR